MTELFNTRLKQCLKEKNIKQIELARMTNITASSISDWLKGKYIPKLDKIYIIAECLEVDPNWLIGIKDNNYKKNKIDDYSEELVENVNKIPILGTICAGDGIYCEENFDGYIYIDNTTRADFALTVKGDSMIDAGIFEGDIVFIKKQSFVQNGKIAAVLLTDSNEASLKKFYKTKDNIILQPCNSEYEPIVTRDVFIIGECVGVFRNL